MLHPDQFPVTFEEDTKKRHKFNTLNMLVAKVQGQEVGHVEHTSLREENPPHAVNLTRVFDIYVDPQHRNKGVGIGMLNHLASQNKYGAAGVEVGTPFTAEGLKLWNRFRKGE